MLTWLEPVASNWMFLGQYLEVNEKLISEIEGQFKASQITVQECLLKVLVAWRDGNPNPTCQAIIEALRKMDEEVLIANKFKDIEDGIIDKGNSQTVESVQ